MQEKQVMMITYGDKAVRVIQCDFCSRQTYGAEPYRCPCYTEKPTQAVCEGFIRCEDISLRLEGLLAWN